MRFIAMALSCLLMANAAAAQSDAGTAYLGAGASFANEEFDLPPGVDADDAFSLDLLAGYRINPSFSVEAEARFFSDFDLDGVGGGDIEGISATANAKLFPVPTAKVAQPFALLGIGFLDLDGPSRIDANESDWMLDVGGGLDFPIADRTILEVNAVYHFPRGDLDDFEFWTIGGNVQYRF